MKNKFSGKYYKFVTCKDFSFAIIDSISNEGPAVQLITKEGSFRINDINTVIIESDKITFNIDQDDLKMTGVIRMSDFHPLKKKVMGPFSIFKMECSHEIYSMYHKLAGEIDYNGILYSFDNGYGYIEGDSGVNFPKKYIWYNSVGKDYGVTMAIATIPFGFIKFTGILGFVSYDNKEYYLCTYTGAKIVKTSPSYFEIKKGKYHLSVSVKEDGGHLLKAPIKGNMERYIKENVASATAFSFTKNGEVILEKSDDKSSLEYMY